MKIKPYDVLTWIARYLLPAFAALWVALSGVWNLPYAKEIAGTISAVTAFLNAILGISSIKYWKEHEINNIIETENYPDDSEN